MFNWNGSEFLSKCGLGGRSQLSECGLCAENFCKGWGPRATSRQSFIYFEAQCGTLYLDWEDGRHQNNCTTSVTTEPVPSGSFISLEAVAARWRAPLPFVAWLRERSIAVWRCFWGLEEVGSY